MESPTKQLPQTLYIADPKERLINFFVDELFDQLIKEVEEEQKVNDNPHK